MDETKRFIAPEDLETIEFDWGTSKWMSTPDVTGAESFSAGITILKPGRAHERHVHPDSEEILYFLSGEGKQTIGEETRSVRQGELVYIPAGVEHSTENTGWAPLQFLAAYGPPGPEAAIRDAEGSTIHPPGEHSE